MAFVLPGCTCTSSETLGLSKRVLCEVGDRLSENNGLHFISIIFPRSIVEAKIIRI